MISIKKSSRKFSSGFTRTPKFGVSLQSKRGFTLIELLIVIAIIGILSAIVLAALNTARSKGADAAVKSNLKGITSQATIVYDDNGVYDAVCADIHVMSAVTAAGVAGGGAGECNSSATEWAVQAPLKTLDQFGVGSGQDYWCVDSNSVYRVEDDVLGAATQCP